MSEEMWVIEGSLDSHDRVQRLLRGLVLSPAARRLTPADILAAVRTLPGVEEQDSYRISGFAPIVDVPADGSYLVVPLSPRTTNPNTFSSSSTDKEEE